MKVLVYGGNGWIGQQVIELLNENYIDCKFLNNIYNTDTKLIYYIIMNLNRLLDYNKQIEQQLYFNFNIKNLQIHKLYLKIHHILKIILEIKYK